MAIRKLRYDGEMILRKKARDIEKIDADLLELVNDMFETMYLNNGVGLAAPQIGISKRLAVIDTYKKGEKIVLINPTILKKKGSVLLDEGCLSIPGAFGKVFRPEEVVLEATDIDGKKYKICAKGLLAQAICHEVGHLNGELYIDHLEPNTLFCVDKKGNKIFDADYDSENHKVVERINR